MASDDHAPRRAPAAVVRDARPKDRPDDVVLIHGRTEDGKGLHVLRKKASEVSLGVVRPLEHGKAIRGELVSLSPRPDAPMVCDVQSHGEVPSPLPSPQSIGSRGEGSNARALPSGARSEAGAEISAASPGPARVSTAKYRSGWDRMWGSRRRSGGELN